MSFRVKLTRDEEWPIVFDDGVCPLTVKAKGFRIYGCNVFTNRIHKNKYEVEVIDGFWVDASSAITDSEGIVTFM